MQVVRVCEDCQAEIRSGCCVHYCAPDNEYRGHYNGAIICFKRTEDAALAEVSGYERNLIRRNLI